MHDRDHEHEKNADPTSRCCRHCLTLNAGAQVSQVATDLSALRTALEAYSVDNAGKYPASCGGFPNDPRSNLRMLTTPLAYLPSLPLDPYQTVSNTQSFPHGRFAYLYAEKASQVNFCFQNWDNTFGNLPLRANSKWVLISAGPDQDFDYRQGPYSINLVYDATNGTSSSGDIFGFSAVPTSADAWNYFR